MASNQIGLHTLCVEGCDPSGIPLSAYIRGRMPNLLEGKRAEDLVKRAHLFPGSSETGSRVRTGCLLFNEIAAVR